MKVSDEDINRLRHLARRSDGGIQGQQVRRGFEGMFNDLEGELLALRVVADAAGEHLDIPAFVEDVEGREKLKAALKAAGR